MPSLITKRGCRRYLGAVWVDNVRGPTKLFQDATRDSFRKAIEWENVEREKLRKKLISIHTESSTIRAWINKYMTHVQTNGFSNDTYNEKRSVFERFVAFERVDPDTDVRVIDRYLAVDYFTAQMKTPRKNGGKVNPGDDKSKGVHMPTGNAINKDRKNLAAAWTWGKENMRNWPNNTENPFLATARKAEKRHPRYVPPPEDFWAVFDYVDGLARDDEDAHIQDRVMLLAYLHTAARRSELFNATWSDVDFGRRKIRLWTRKREGGALEFDWIPMTEELRGALEIWKKRRETQATEDRNHIFVCLSSQINGEYYGLAFTSRQHVMRRWCKRVNVPAFGWHAIRHLTASTLYAAGTSQAVIQAILRHKSPSTTARYLRSIGLNEVRAVLDDGLRRDKTAQVIPFEQKKTA